jgi:hypothetical protein
VIYEDENSNTSVSALLDFTCWEIVNYGHTFISTIDPGTNPFRDKYWIGSVPTTMVLDDDMVIRYKAGDNYNPSALIAIIEQVLQE